MKPSRDHFERLAQRLWKRWHRAARYAMEHTCVDAMLRFRLHDTQEARRAVRDVLQGREGLAHMLVRARRVVRNRLRHKVEDLAIRLAYAMPTAGRYELARAAAAEGYHVAASTMRRVLQRRGLWRVGRGSAVGSRMTC